MSVQNTSEEFKNLVYRQYLSMVAGKCNLDLRFREDACPCTDGKVVIIPQDCLNDEKREELISYVLHEAGHARYTCFEVARKLKPYEHELANAIEDVRIENRMCRLYGGAKGYFAKSFEKTLPEFLTTMAKQLKKMNLLGKFCSFVFAEAETYSFEHMYDVSEFKKLTEVALAKEFTPQESENLFAEVRTAVQGVPLLKSTEDTISLVKRLVAILERYAPKAKNQQPKQSTKSQPNPDQKGSSGKSEGSKKGKNESQKSKGSKENSKESGNGSKEGSKEPGDGCGSSTPQPQSFEESMLQQQQELENSKKKLNPLDRGKALKIKNESGAASRGRKTELPRQVRAEDPHFPKDAQSTQIGIDLIRYARRESSQVATALRSFIEAKAETSIDYVSSGSKVKTSRLYRVPTGSFKVFTRTSEDPEASNTAVCILLDTSGSMGMGAASQGAQHDSSMCRATKAALALCLALRNLAGIENVSSSVIAFPGLLIEQTARNQVQSGWGRKNPFAQYLLHHGETLTQERAMHFAHFDAFGPTPLNKALEAAIIDLMGVSDVTRRVVFVITDGNTRINENLVASMRKQGIEVFGLSIEAGTEELDNAFGKDNVEECSSQTLTKALINLAKKALV